MKIAAITYYEWRAYLRAGLARVKRDRCYIRLAWGDSRWGEVTVIR